MKKKYDGLIISEVKVTWSTDCSPVCASDYDTTPCGSSCSGSVDTGC